jgi:hypothetical protein
MDFKEFSEGSEVIIKALFEAGATKDNTLGFLREVLENPKYINDDDLMNQLMIDKLGVDVYIHLKNSGEW